MDGVVCDVNATGTAFSRDCQVADKMLGLSLKSNASAKAGATR
jgi:hypothetical protein